MSIFLFSTVVCADECDVLPRFLSFFVSFFRSFFFVRGMTGRKTERLRGGQTGRQREQHRAFFLSSFFSYDFRSYHCILLFNFFFPCLFSLSVYVWCSSLVAAAANPRSSASSAACGPFTAVACANQRKVTCSTFHSAPTCP